MARLPSSSLPAAPPSSARREKSSSTVRGMIPRSSDVESTAVGESQSSRPAPCCSGLPRKLPPIIV